MPVERTLIGDFPLFGVPSAGTIDTAANRLVVCGILLALKPVPILFPVFSGKCSIFVNLFVFSGQVTGTDRLGVRLQSGL